MYILFIIASVIILIVTSVKLKTDILNINPKTVSALRVVNIVGIILMLASFIFSAADAVLYFDLMLSRNSASVGYGGLAVQRGFGADTLVLAIVMSCFAIVSVILAILHIKNCRKLKKMKTTVSPANIQYCAKCGAALLPGALHCAKCGASAKSNNEGVDEK